MTSITRASHSCSRFFVATLLTGLLGAAPVWAAPGPVPIAIAPETPVEVYITVSDVTSASFGNLVYVVPAGKMLTVDSMGLLPTLIGTSSGYTCVVLNEDAGGTILSLYGFSSTPGGAASPAVQPLHMHVVSGQKIVVNVFKTGSGPLSAYVSLSGHLENTP